MGTTPTIDLKGKSGKTFSFYIYDLTTTFKAVGGVYVFTKATTNTDNSITHEIIYVGMTEDLSTRFTNHHKKDCYTKKGANRICVRQVEQQTDREQLEKDLILNYNPHCNDQLTK